MDNNTLNRNSFYTKLAVILCCSFALPSVGHSQTQPQPPTASSLSELLECRNLASDHDRLVCFDSKAELLSRQTSSGELVAVNKSEILQARRGLFGLEKLQVPAFLSGSNEEVDEITSTLVSASQNGNGQWRITLADDSIWEQTETTSRYFATRPGTEVRIRRAALGSYFMNVGTARAIRVARRR